MLTWVVDSLVTIQQHQPTRTLMKRLYLVSRIAAFVALIPSA